jgi:hypothetical protein
VQRAEGGLCGSNGSRRVQQIARRARQPVQPDHNHRIAVVLGPRVKKNRAGRFIPVGHLRAQREHEAETPDLQVRAAHAGCVTMALASNVPVRKLIRVVARRQ